MSTFAPSTFTAAADVDTIGNVDGVTTLTVDVLESGLRVTFKTVLTSPVWSTAAINGNILTTAGSLDVTGRVSAGGALGGFDARCVTLAGGQIMLDWNSLGYMGGTVLELSFAENPFRGAGTLHAAAPIRARRPRRHSPSGRGS